MKTDCVHRLGSGNYVAHYPERMGRRIYTTGPLTDAQIKAIYATAEKLKVGVGLWQDTPGPNRSSFK